MCLSARWFSVDTERIEELPVESRNYLNFVLLAPGVASSAQQPVGAGSGKIQFSLDYEF